MADSPRLTPGKGAERAAREARLAEALRDNLRRRKEQARARAADRAPSDTPAGPGERRRKDAAPTG
jgi:hypothetical protein